MSSGQTWHCDKTIHPNPSNVNASLRASDDPLRPWKNHRVPDGSTVGSVLSQFSSTAKHRFLKDIQVRAKSVGFTPEESLAIYQDFLRARPVNRTRTIGTLIETSFNKTFRPSVHELPSAEIIKEARSGKSSRYMLTPSGEFRTLIKWQTRCSACSEDFLTGQRVVEMGSGEWRHYWLVPKYGFSFTEVIDTYRGLCEDGSPMPGGGNVSMDLTGTLFSPR